MLVILHIIFMAVKDGLAGIRNSQELVNKAWDAGQMDELQEERECCGKIGATDYIALERAVPPSCFLNRDTSNGTNLFEEGCVERLSQYYEREGWYFCLLNWLLLGFEVSSAAMNVGGIKSIQSNHCFLSIAGQILGFLLAICLVIAFRKTQRRMHL